MITIGIGAHGMSVIPDSIAVGGEKHVPWQEKEEDAWLTFQEIEKESGVSIETLTLHGLQLRGLKKCRRRTLNELRDAIKSLAKQWK